MSSVLVIGYDPREIPGADGDALMGALEAESARFRELGIDTANCLIVADESAEATVVAALTERPWDVVVVGGGIRKPDPMVPVFEHIVALVREHAPDATLAFNTSIATSVEAARRVL